MFALFFLHFVPFFSDWLNFVAQELKPKEKIYLVNKLHASCRLSHSAHIKTLRKTITITKRCRINRVFLDGPVLLWQPWKFFFIFVLCYFFPFINALVYHHIFRVKYIIYEYQLFKSKKLSEWCERKPRYLASIFYIM